MIGDDVRIPRHLVAEIRTRITEHGYINLVVLSPDPTALIQSLDWDALLGVWVRRTGRTGYALVTSDGAVVEITDAP